MKKAGSERTSSAIAKMASQLLAGRSFQSAEAWLHTVADDPTSETETRGHAVVLLGILQQMRRVAGSALTQT